eukprot:7833148-Pyramimonas_sp.AAC.1
MAANKAKTTSTKPRRRIRFDAHTGILPAHRFRQVHPGQMDGEAERGQHCQDTRSATTLVVETERRRPTTLSTGSKAMAQRST